jgi:NitT/TauT family transport system substrate-binding protein
MRQIIVTREERKRPSRRNVLQAIAGLGATAAAGITSPAIAQRRNITFTLPWAPEGPNLMSFVAKAKGYWSRNGLDVDIARGTGSVTAAQAIGRGSFQFGLAAATAGLQQAALGLPIAQISCCAYDAFMGLVTLNNSGFAKPKDLEGKKLASTTTSGEYPFIPAFAEKAGLDLSKVEILQVDPNVRQRLLIEKQVAAISAFASSVMPPFIQNGFSPRVFLFSKVGLPLYGNTLFTQQPLLQQDSALCGAIAQGLNEAIKFVLLQPEESLDIFFKINPEMALADGARAQTRLSLDFYRYSVAHEAAMKHGIGYAPLGDYKVMIDLVMKYVAPNGKRPDAEEIISNKYAGDVTLTPAEWEDLKPSFTVVTNLVA